MPLFHIVILALVQGITEFLPISSSGHLALSHALMGETGSLAQWEQNLTMDIAVHIGTLLAVLLYYRKDVWHMACAALSVFNKKSDQEGTQLIYLIIVGSLPVIAAGFFIHELAPAFVNSLKVTAWCTLIFGIVLWVADTKFPVQRTIQNMTIKDAILIGLAQILALVPGTSRSGITMTAGRMLGFSRKESAHYSLLLAMVAISGAGALTGLSLLDSENTQLGFDVLIAIILSFLSAYAAIALMLKWLEKISFTPFAIYRIVLGVILLGLIYSGAL
ncbi:MAG: undecaprenyl-diphosphate phosphatase [Rhodospirillales bacterium]|nr:undecaprenyl-diphosphate phosphatase [Rhodospirillales bacterium]